MPWQVANHGHQALRDWYGALSDDDAALVKPYLAGPKKRAQEIDGVAA